MSGKNEIFENPFVATGFNKANNVLTGSISVTRSAPGETNECRIAFAVDPRNPAVLQTRYVEIDADDGVQGVSELGKAVMVQDGTSWKIRFDKRDLVGGCEWILPFVGAPSITQQGNALSIEIPKRKPGAWVSVRTIKSKRASFYKSPTDGDIEKTFLVFGDTIFVYEEKPDWYFVKFEGRKKKTTGWIRRADTIQF